jgi:hypothetical protein
MKWKDIASMTRSDLENTPTKDLRKYASQLNSAANRRARNLEARDLVTPASVEMDENGGKFTIRGKQSRDDVIEEMTRAKKFLRSGTSTIRDAQAFMKNEIEDLTDVTGEESDAWAKDFDWYKYYAVINHAMEHKGYVDSDRIRAKIIELVDSNPFASIEDLKGMIDEWADGTYKKGTSRRTI